MIDCCGSSAPGVCRECGKTPTIAAHIVPKAFARTIRGDNPHNIHVKVSENITRPTTQLGAYDSNILCASCDGRLGLYDEYAIQFIRNYANIVQNVGDNFFISDDVNCELFSKFILSLLWRASISNHRDFSHIKIGKYEKEIQDILFDRTPLCDLEAFDLMLMRFKSEKLDVEGMYSVPERGRFEGLNMWGFIIGGFRIMAKLDNKRLPKLFRPLSINKSLVMRGFIGKFEDSIEFRHIVNFSRSPIIRSRNM